MRHAVTVFFLLLPLSSAFAETKYVTEFIKVQKGGELCIFLGIEGSTGSVIHCAARPNNREVVPQSRIEEMNARIDATLGSAKWLVDALFLAGRPKDSDYSIADFEAFLSKLETGDCGNAFATYKKTRADLTKQQDDMTPRNFRAAIASAREDLLTHCR